MLTPFPVKVPELLETNVGTEPQPKLVADTAAAAVALAVAGAWFDALAEPTVVRATVAMTIKTTEIFPIAAILNLILEVTLDPLASVLNRFTCGSPPCGLTRTASPISSPPMLCRQRSLATDS